MQATNVATTLAVPAAPPAAGTALVSVRDLTRSWGKEVDAVRAVPFVVVGAAVALVLLAALVARSTERRPIALSLRGAA